MALKRSTAHILRIINVATNNSPTYNTSHPKSFPYAEMCSVRGPLLQDLKPSNGSTSFDKHATGWAHAPYQVTAGVYNRGSGPKRPAYGVGTGAVA